MAKKKQPKRWVYSPSPKASTGLDATTKAQVEANLAKERDRVKQLEAEKKKIYDGGLH